MAVRMEDYQSYKAQGLLGAEVEAYRRGDMTSLFMNAIHRNCWLQVMPTPVSALTKNWPLKELSSFVRGRMLNIPANAAI